MKRVLLFLTGLLVSITMGFGQVGINANSSSPHPSAGLDVNFTNKGLLPPRMTKAQRDAIVSPATGLMVVCTDCGYISPAMLCIYLNGSWQMMTEYCPPPAPANPLTLVALPNSITWRWSSFDLNGHYRWGMTDNPAMTMNLDTASSYTETGLSPSTTYTRYVWVYDECGISSSIALTQTTLWGCGAPTPVINHVTTNGVAPVNKSTAYGTVTNIPGEPAKCWITKNLGATQQATAVNDATEESAGWYWQFNRKQGYKHDGTSRTPNTTWITSINENSGWLTANDPCTLELGAVWRMPTYTEWYNVDNAGGWDNWNGPWNSGLKLHAAGDLASLNGSVYERGIYGLYWSSSPYNAINGWFLSVFSGHSYMENSEKANGFSARCVRD